MYYDKASINIAYKIRHEETYCVCIDNCATKTFITLMLFLSHDVSNHRNSTVCEAAFTGKHKKDASNFHMTGYSISKSLATGLFVE